MAGERLDEAAAGRAGGATGGGGPGGAAPGSDGGGRHRGPGLSAKLLWLTVSFVMLAEVLIFVPSIANYRVTWLNDRLTAANLAALAAEAVPGGAVPAPLRNELLSGVQALAIAVKRGDQRVLVLPADGSLTIDDTYDLRLTRQGAWGGLADRMQLIVSALQTLATTEERTIRVIGAPEMITRANGGAGTDFVEIVLPEAPLRRAMVRYSLNILLLSVIISIIAAALVYLALNAMLVRPMQAITRNMLRFAQAPEDASRIITPSPRGDEIGTAERELEHLQRELAHMLHQKNRLAQLGLAVSKINHDLRNMLANAQLISDRLVAIPDPTVQRFAPKLIASLDRAIGFCNDTLRFGRSEEAPPRRRSFALRGLAEEVGDGLSLPRESIGWSLDIAPELEIDADPEHLYRVLNNLVRNAVQAIETGAAEPAGGRARGSIAIRARRTDRTVTVEVQDDGPGVPEAQLGRLFQAFQVSKSRGGSGLGLSIAAELVAAHGGQLTLAPSDKGACFRFDIPDRPAGSG